MLNPSSETRIKAFIMLSLGKQLLNVVVCSSTGRSIWSDSWVGLTRLCDVPPYCPLAQPVLPISHQPKPNQADGGTAQIKFNPTRLSGQMDHPVLMLWTGFGMDPRSWTLRTTTRTTLAGANTRRGTPSCWPPRTRARRGCARQPSSVPSGMEDS